ncbi:hypothetical protein M011DRAFT_475525 [Sporormia fimetaria CBS 119925]|uniref:Uncharacterized protein n=1 Tax=Sporormia fimetaria CBS 119925 TaxID=1340428 RepID=A0A6A6VFQ8_9PLEO|nr:hypothetical protein M011DRAFT_475525 [Sporormia fimetaria CBS 119925]
MASADETDEAARESIGHRQTGSLRIRPTISSFDSIPDPYAMAAATSSRDGQAPVRSYQTSPVSPLNQHITWNESSFKSPPRQSRKASNGGRSPHDISPLEDTSSTFEPRDARKGSTVTIKPKAKKGGNSKVEKGQRSPTVGKNRIGKKKHGLARFVELVVDGHRDGPPGDGDILRRKHGHREKQEVLHHQTRPSGSRPLTPPGNGDLVWGLARHLITKARGHEDTDRSEKKQQPQIHHQAQLPLESASQDEWRKAQNRKTTICSLSAEDIPTLMTPVLPIRKLHRDPLAVKSLPPSPPPSPPLSQQHPRPTPPRITIPDNNAAKPPSPILESSISPGKDHPAQSTDQRAPPQPRIKRHEQDRRHHPLSASSEATAQTSRSILIGASNSVRYDAKITSRSPSHRIEAGVRGREVVRDRSRGREPVRDERHVRHLYSNIESGRDGRGRTAAQVGQRVVKHSQSVPRLAPPPRPPRSPSMEPLRSTQPNTTFSSPLTSYPPSPLPKTHTQRHDKEAPPLGKTFDIFHPFTHKTHKIDKSKISVPGPMLSTGGGTANVAASNGGVGGLHGKFAGDVPAPWDYAVPAHVEPDYDSKKSQLKKTEPHRPPLKHLADRSGFHLHHIGLSLTKSREEKDGSRKHVEKKKKKKRSNSDESFACVGIDETMFNRTNAEKSREESKDAQYINVQTNSNRERRRVLGYSVVGPYDDDTDDCAVTSTHDLNVYPASADIPEPLRIGSVSERSGARSRLGNRNTKFYQPSSPNRSSSYHPESEEGGGEGAEEVSNPATCQASGCQSVKRDAQCQTQGIVVVVEMRKDAAFGTYCERGQKTYSTSGLLSTNSRREGKGVEKGLLQEEE